MKQEPIRDQRVKVYRNTPQYSLAMAGIFKHTISPLSMRLCRIDSQWRKHLSSLVFSSLSFPLTIHERRELLHQTLSSKVKLDFLRDDCAFLSSVLRFSRKSFYLKTSLNSESYQTPPWYSHSSS